MVDSKHNARYHLSLSDLEGGNGYVVTMESSPADRAKFAESWHRNSLGVGREEV